MVKAFDLRLRAREFDPRPWRYRVSTLGKLLTPMCLSPSSRPYKLVAALQGVAGVTAGLAESNGSLPPGL